MWRTVACGATVALLALAACGGGRRRPRWRWGPHRRGRLGLGPGVWGVAGPRRSGTKVRSSPDTDPPPGVAPWSWAEARSGSRRTTSTRSGGFRCR